MSESAVNEGIVVRIVNDRPEGYLTVQEFAKKCGKTVGTIQQWILRERIKPIRIGNQNWIKDSTEKPKDLRKFENRSEKYKRTKEIKGATFREFANNVERILNETKCPQSVLARYIGVTKQHLNNILQVRRNFIARAYAVAIFDALEWFIEVAERDGINVSESRKCHEGIRKIIESDDAKKESDE